VKALQPKVQRVAHPVGFSMRIQELAGRTGVSIRSLRYYEQKQLIASRRLDNGYRDFDETAIERVKTIQLYFGLGLTTGQIEQIINQP
jgi:MerR family transcriptional regulator, Zn(II)-responsive regulator of zntA